MKKLLLLIAMIPFCMVHSQGLKKQSKPKESYYLCEKRETNTEIIFDIYEYLGDKKGNLLSSQTIFVSSYSSPNAYNIIKRAYIDGFDYAKSKAKTDLVSYERGLEELQKELYFAQNHKNIRGHELTLAEYELTLAMLIIGKSNKII